MKIARLQAEFEAEKLKRKASDDPYSDCTIYVVREAAVKAHYRRATVALRIKH